MSTITSSETTFQEAATYGGVVDAIGGIATVILAIVALSGVSQSMLGGIATIVFGAALLIQGGTMLTEYTKLTAPPGMAVRRVHRRRWTFGAVPGRSSRHRAWGARPGRHLIADAHRGCGDGFGSALLLSSNSVWHLYRNEDRPVTGRAVPARSGEPKSLPVKWPPARQFCSACRVSPRSCLAFSR